MRGEPAAIHRTRAHTGTQSREGRSTCTSTGKPRTERAKTCREKGRRKIGNKRQQSGYDKER